MLILLVCRMSNSYLWHHTRLLFLVDLRRRKSASQSVPHLNEPGQSEDKELMPQPKHTAPKTKVMNDGILELASTDDPEWGMSLAGDNDENKDDELDSADLGAMEEDDSLGTDDHDSDLEESPLKQKNKSSKRKKADKGKEKVTLRAAISQGCSRKQLEVRRT